MPKHVGWQNFRGVCAPRPIGDPGEGRQADHPGHDLLRRIAHNRQVAHKRDFKLFYCIML